MSLSRKNNWSANSIYLHWKIISLHQLRIIIAKLAKRHTAPIYIIDVQKIEISFCSFEECPIPIFFEGRDCCWAFQDLLAFWPFVSFQEIKLPFPRIKLFLFFRRIVLLNTAIFAASTRGYRRGFKRLQLFNFFPQPCNIHGLWLSLGEFQILICWPEIYYVFIQGVLFLVCIILKVLK